MEIWTLKSWHEAGKPAPRVGQFPAITLFADPLAKTGGQTNWVQLTKREIDWIKSWPLNKAAWHWADHRDGTIYLGEDWKTDRLVKWPRIALASADDGHRNTVAITDFSAKCAKIVGIPRVPYYTSFTTIAYLVHNCYLVGKDGLTRSNVLFHMPIWNPDSGFKVSKGDRGLWIKREFLKEHIGDL